MRSKLLCLADTKLVLGNWYAECVMNGRSVPDFATMLGICTASYGQARALYRYLAPGQEEYARLERGRGAGEIASMELLDTPPRHWEDFILTTWLAEQSGWTQVAPLLTHPDRAVAALARKIGEEAYFHLKYGSGWFRVLRAEPESLVRLQESVAVRLPLALDWFTADTEAASGLQIATEAVLAGLGLCFPSPPTQAAGGFDPRRRRRTDLPPGLFEVIRFKSPEHAH